MTDATSLSLPHVAKTEYQRKKETKIKTELLMRSQNICEVIPQGVQKQSTVRWI